jgi:pseudaminic acid synthase
MSNAIAIAGRQIGAGHPPYIIAELSGNHNGDLSRALAIIEQCAAAGVDAVKLQTYTADTMTIDCDRSEFRIKGGLWDGYTLYQLYQEAQTPWDWHRALFARGRDLGVAVFSSPFDASSIDFLEELGAPAYKIASFELIDHPLLRRVAATGKPVIVSTGMASAEEIAEAVAVLDNAGCRQLALLHCISAYPAPPEQCNLRTLQDLAARHGKVVGLSDHTLTTSVAVAAVALGASLIEKHVTMRRADGGPDAAFSLEPEEVKRLVDDCRTAFLALGQPNYARAESERGNLVFRRSIFAIADIAAGEILTESNIRIIRPGFGMAPKEFPHLLGRRASRDIARGTPLTPDLLA